MIQRLFEGGQFDMRDDLGSSSRTQVKILEIFVQAKPL